MVSLSRHWRKLVYLATLFNYGLLLYLPHWLGVKLGCKLSLPDLTPFFSNESSVAFRSCLLSQGQVSLISFGQLHTFGADLIFPVLFALSLTLVTLQAANYSPRFSRFPKTFRLSIIAFAPISYAICDYIENSLVWHWLTSPQVDWVATNIMIATLLKFVFIVIALAFLIMFSLAKLKHLSRE